MEAWTSRRRLVDGIRRRRGQVRRITVQSATRLVGARDAAKGECTLTTNEQYLQAVVDGIVTKPAREAVRAQ
jgi:hypothetical protein